MTIQQHLVAGESIKITAPLPGEFDKDKFLDFYNTTDLFGFDVESTAFTNQEFWDPSFRVRTVQVATEHEAWVLRLDDPAQREAFESYYLRDESKKFAVYTETEALAVLREFNTAIAPRCIDVYLLSRLHDLRTKAEGVPHDLKSVSQRYIDGQLQGEKEELRALFVEMWVEQGGKRNAREELVVEHGWNNVDLQHPTFIKYAGLDPLYTLRLLRFFQQSEHIVPTLAMTEHWLGVQSVGMRAKGVLVDGEYTQNLHDEMADLQAVPRDKFWELTGVKINSVKRIEWFEDRGVVFEVFTKTGNGSLDKKEGLPNLLKRYARDEHEGEVKEALLLIQEYSEIGNLVSNTKKFLENRDPQGYVHPRIQQMEAHTGRMSITGTALQTLPKKDTRQRNCFLADPGYIFIGADFEQVELRLAAAMANEAKLLDAIEAGEDLHWATARLMYGPNATKMHRTIAKTINFAVLYGAGKKTVSKQTGISEEKAQEALTLWREGYPNLSAYLRQVAQIEDRVINPAGRSIPVDPDRTYANPNYAIQSLGRDVLAHALYRFVETKGWRDALVFPIHDEVVAQVRLDQAQQACEDLGWAMTFRFRNVPIAATAEVVGRRWRPLEDPLNWDRVIGGPEKDDVPLVSA